MRPTGFSTGALTKGDFRTALTWIDSTDSDAIELSALREDELPALLNSIDKLDLHRFRYRSIHAPKEFKKLSERTAVSMLLPYAEKGFRIVLHPDAISDPDAWRSLGRSLCLENMDIRKTIGRTAQEMRAVFARLPEARFCFDIGHARQVDPTMAVAIAFVRQYGDRIEQVHASEVDTSGNHWAMSKACLAAYRVFAECLAPTIAIIVESQVPRPLINKELSEARSLFD